MKPAGVVGPLDLSTSDSAIIKEGNKRRADELAGEGVVLAQLAADYATTFSAFCK